MEISVPAGKYVLAVSGGVDSMVLLDLLAKNKAVSLVVAHFEHGIRLDSRADEELVKKVSQYHGATVEIGRGNLGSSTSEDQARKARYDFLYSIKKKHKADAIITAHHEDDFIETAFLNILRGTNRKGLSSILDNSEVLRPLLHVPKQAILDYAKTSHLEWREDSSNQDTKYLRNYIRRNLLPSLSPEQRQSLTNDLQRVSVVNKNLDMALGVLAEQIMVKNKIRRLDFIGLPSEVANELVAFWLAREGIKNYDKKTIERLALAIKTALPNTRHNIRKNAWLVMESTNAYFEIDR